MQGCLSPVVTRSSVIARHGTRRGNPPRLSVLEATDRKRDTLVVAVRAHVLVVVAQVPVVSDVRTVLRSTPEVRVAANAVEVAVAVAV